ncbi:hypothetical protein K439DRAFT_1200689 [Ramaria rubella]|nr:hypothetical protein K439DRAFT_1200689 [Ramaria rubella]
MGRGFALRAEIKIKSSRFRAQRWGRGTYGISEDRTGRLYVLTVIAPVFKPKPTKPINIIFVFI